MKATGKGWWTRKTKGYCSLLTMCYCYTLDHHNSFILERNTCPSYLTQTKFLMDRPIVSHWSSSLLGSPPTLAGTRPRVKMQTPSLWLPFSSCPWFCPLCIDIRADSSKLIPRLTLLLGHSLGLGYPCFPPGGKPGRGWGRLWYWVQSHLTKEFQDPGNPRHCLEVKGGSRPVISSACEGKCGPWRHRT